MHAPHFSQRAYSSQNKQSKRLCGGQAAHQPCLAALGVETPHTGRCCSCICARWHCLTRPQIRPTRSIIGFPLKAVYAPCTRASICLSCHKHNKLSSWQRPCPSKSHTVIKSALRLTNDDADCFLLLISADAFQHTAAQTQTGTGKCNQELKDCPVPGTNYWSWIEEGPNPFTRRHWLGLTSMMCAALTCHGQETQIR